MSKITVAPVQTKRVIRCPACDQFAFEVEHLYSLTDPTGEWKWSCGHCGRLLVITKVDGELYATMDVDAPCTRRIDLLRLDPHELKHPLYLFVPRTTGRKDLTYWYEKHTCPTNWLKNVVQVSYDNDQDPHGLFNFVTSALVDDQYNTFNEVEGYPQGNALFPAVFAPGTTDPKE